MIRGNHNEKYRHVGDSIVDERTLREIYLKGFEIAIKEGKPSTVMSAYNKVNGIYCSDNKYLLIGAADNSVTVVEVASRKIVNGYAYNAKNKVPILMSADSKSIII